ncbi:BPSL0067 family protein [Lampropedia aestuarii]|uniref:BPSL0067 family protein n=1 Tax=Lampropedia aestuarii TaxID=2562762 RepID=UPI0014561EB3
MAGWPKWLNAKHFAKAPQTALWKKGKQVQGHISLAAGTAIATFGANGKAAKFRPAPSS